MHRTELDLGEGRVHLDLVDAGGDAGRGDDVVEVTGSEVGDADRADEATLATLDEALPGVDIEVLARVRPVDEDEVDDVEAQATQAVLDRGDRQGLLVEAAGDLGRDEDVLAVEATATERLADLLLILVVHGGVDESIALLEGRHHRGDALLAAQRIGAEADLRDDEAVVQGPSRDAGGFALGFARGFTHPSRLPRGPRSVRGCRHERKRHQG